MTRFQEGSTKFIFTLGYDSLFSEKNIHFVEKWIIRFALIGFGLHLLLIYANNNFPDQMLLFKQLSPNYLKAIYTPFSLVLFYEVFTLVIILPRSIVAFIGKQYEIITLIGIRDFFHKIAEYDLENNSINSKEFIYEIGHELGAALIMFLLTIIYYKLYNKRDSARTIDLRKYVNLKKRVSVLLTFTLMALSIYSFYTWGTQVAASHYTMDEFPNPNVIFYKDFFSIMVLTDVALLLISFVYFKSYDVIVRNAGFIVSTILIRFALTAHHPYNVYLYIMSMALGVSLMLLYLYSHGRLFSKASNETNSSTIE
jgi:hypothetical protein